MDLERLEALAGDWSAALERWEVLETIGDGTIEDGTIGDGTTGDGTIGDGTIGDGTIEDGTMTRAWFGPAQNLVDIATARDTVGVRLAAEVLPPSGARVLDVGCGGGRASVPLVPPATTLVGVDTNPEMLAAFTLAAGAAGANAITIGGSWPEVAIDTPVCDVAVCQHVIYDVADIVPFLVALTDRARLAVVLVLSERHPMTPLNDAWRHFWQIGRPLTPVADDVIAILRELDEDPEVIRFASELPALPVTPDLVETARRRLGLPPERSDEVEAYLRAHPVRFPDAYVALRWPGRA